MTCEERQQFWNDLLDARGRGAWAFEPDWDAHADCCERCRAISEGYESLRLALEAWPGPPPASSASLARLADLRVPGTCRRDDGRLVRFMRVAMPIGLAASLLAIAWIDSSPDWLERQFAAEPSLSLKARPWAHSIQAAKRATIELAREAAAPAARIGRAVLDLEKFEGAGRSSARRPREPVAGPGWISPDGQARDLPGQIPDSARHAFSFLLGSTADGPSPVEPSGGL